MIPKELKKEIEKKAKKLKKHDYIDISNGLITSVKCKCDGNPIQELRPAWPHKTYEKDGKDYILSTLVALPTYAEVTFEFEDGSKHITPICKDCVNRITPEMADDMYAADLLQWEKEGWTSRWDYYGNRKVKRIV